MMLFMRTFSIFILIVILTVFGAYLLDSEIPKKQVLANKIVQLPTLFTLNPDYFEPVSQNPPTLSIKNSKIDKSKEQINTQVMPSSTKKKKVSNPPAISNPKTPPVTVVVDKTPNPPAPNEETTPSITTPNTEPTVSPVQPSQPVDTLITPTNDDSSSTTPQDSPADTTDPADSFLVIPTNTTNNDSSITDPQQILDAQRNWMETTLGASESELPTEYISEETSVISPDTGNITFDKTITGSDFSIQYIVSDGVLSIEMIGSVPDNLIPPGFSN